MDSTKVIAQQAAGANASCGSGQDDARFMGEALKSAALAAAAGEVPVGAVVVYRGEVIGRGHNAPIGQNDPSAHAEIVALRDASARLGNYRLSECTLYTTLEPCAMCAGAIQHARIQRLVFGAHDAKAGAAGSVLDLFANPRLNPHTEVAHGVRAEEGAGLLSAFFAARRLKRAAAWPLPDDALRTPPERFNGLPGFPWTPHHVNDLPSLNGLRMAYLDEGPRDAPRAWLCLHGLPAWSYVYRHTMKPWLATGDRVVAPDFVGFGQSDKPKREDWHRFDRHRNILLEFIERLDLRNIVLVVQDWGGILGLTLPMAAPHRYLGLVAMNTLLATGEADLPPGLLAWRTGCADRSASSLASLLSRDNPHLSEAECAAYQAPFPDSGHRAALRAFTALIPDHPRAAGANWGREARAFWSEQWQGKSVMLVGAADPALGLPVMTDLRQQIRGCPEPIVIPQAGEFVLEHGKSWASRVWQAMAGHAQDIAADSEIARRP